MTTRGRVLKEYQRCEKIEHVLIGDFFVVQKTVNKCTLYDLNGKLEKEYLMSERWISSLITLSTSEILVYTNENNEISAFDLMDGGK